MIRRHLVGILAIMAMVLVATSAEAGGGGGTKRTVSIKTQNTAPYNVIVFSIREGQAQPGPASTVASIRKNFGGVIIQSGSTKTVKVSSGKGVLVALQVAGGVLVPPNGFAAQYNLSNGASTTATVVDNGGVPDVFIP